MEWTPIQFEWAKQRSRHRGTIREEEWRVFIKQSFNHWMMPRGEEFCLPALSTSPSSLCWCSELIIKERIERMMKWRVFQRCRLFVNLAIYIPLHVSTTFVSANMLIDYLHVDGVLGVFRLCHTYVLCIHTEYDSLYSTFLNNS